MGSKDKRQGWLRILQKDSNVIVCTKTGEYIRSVIRITPTGKIVTIGLTRREEDTYDHEGFIISDKYYPRHLEEATDERVFKIRHSLVID